VARPHFEYSAGGVVLNESQVLLIRTRDLKQREVWTFPKGKLNEGESSPQAAVREVAEETGWRCRIDAELPRSEYWFHRQGQRIKKTVRWFRMSPLEQVGDPDHEVEEAAWVPISEAAQRLTYQSDRALLKRALPESPEGGLT
jgi:ADP-ribose pyrophosphatase YjhB (NUDIX family)